MSIIEVTSNEGVARLIFLVPIPLVDLGFGYFESGGDCDDFLLRPIGLVVKLIFEDFELEAIHAYHRPLV